MIVRTVSIVFLMLSLSCFGEDNIVLKQGEVEVTFEDVDGYAESIPSDNREGYFSSIKRIDKAITTILNIKQIVNYARTKALLNMEVIDKEVSQKFINYKSAENKFSLLIGKEEALRNYLTLQQSYKYFQLKLKSEVDREALIEMAKEMYMINKENYKSVETRDFDFVAVKYNEANKKHSNELLKSLSDDIRLNGSFEEKIKKYKEKNHNLEVSKVFTKFKHDYHYYEFSNFVFSSDKLGLIDSVLDIKPKLYLVNVIKINEENFSSFESVKNQIIDGLVVSKYEREFQNLLSTITKDKVIVNKKNIQKLQTRYSK